MTKTTVVTGAWGPKRQFYVDTFVAAFDRYWPAEVSLIVYVDQPIALPDTIRGRTILQRNLRHDCIGYAKFIERHENQLAHCGAEPRRGWKSSEIREGYSFRFDAVRFAGQAFAPAHAQALLYDGQIMVWFDADTTTFKPVPAGWIEGLLDMSDGAYLGRAPKHSEIGFWAVRLGPKTRTMVDEFCGLYRTDALFDLAQWHSAFAWDHARQLVEQRAGLNMRNLTPGGEGHVWFKSPLRAYTDHLKGKRKALGRSPERRG